MRPIDLSDPSLARRAFLEEGVTGTEVVDPRVRLALLETILGVARKAVMTSHGFVSAWEFDHNVDADVLHEELKAAVAAVDEHDANEEQAAFLLPPMNQIAQRYA